MGGSQQLLVFLLACLLAAPRYRCAAATGPNSPPFSFNLNFSNRSTYNLHDLSFEGNVTQHGRFVDLTCNAYGLDTSECVSGRMSYNRSSVPLWDENQLASFSTQFTFKIIVPPDNSNKTKGDGMAFFLASYPSCRPPHSGGSYLGLISSEYKTKTAYGQDRFVAVEFDTSSNDWDDKDGDHIAIDISSVADLINTRRLRFSPTGTMKASITFDNLTWMLVASVEFIDEPSDSSSAPIEVSLKLPDPRTLLPPEVAVGFSATTGAAFELHQIFSWSFNSTLAAPVQKGSHNNKEGIVVGSSTGGALILVLLVLCILAWWKCRSTSRYFNKGTGWVGRFKYHELAAATNHFSEYNKLGEGSFGEVHKGFLKELNREVAVKKILKACREGNKDFFDEVQTISRAKHKNLVELLGWSRKGIWNIIEFMCWFRKMKSNLFLAYELVDNDNLHMHLHEEAVVLPWVTRYKIVKDIGSALIYLHHDRDPYILHRDIKDWPQCGRCWKKICTCQQVPMPRLVSTHSVGTGALLTGKNTRCGQSNILLDRKFNAKLADFGLSRTADNGTIEMKLVVGTTSYLDPECIKTGKFNRSSDVYSFGLVPLEIACKKDENRYSQVWQRYHIDKTLTQAADNKLQGEFDERQMERVIILGLWCCQPNIDMRPTMKQAMGFLESDDGPLPELEPMPPEVQQAIDRYLDLV